MQYLEDRRLPLRISFWIPRLRELLKGAKKEMIKRLIEEHAPKLEVPEGLNAEAILWAVYGCEHYVPKYNVPRFEPAYAPGGLYYRNSDLVKEKYRLWGRDAACSYSNFQILFITACELGYDGPPLPLDKDALALLYVVRYINIRIFDKPGRETVEQVGDAYNSGTHLDRIKPERYMKRFRRFYDKSIARQNA